MDIWVFKWEWEDRSFIIIYKRLWEKRTNLNPVIDQETDHERRKKSVSVLMSVIIAAEVSSIENKYHIYPFFLEKKE